MQLKAKNFNELTARELFAILKARAEVFVVEQNCAYLDPDDIDTGALHLWYEEEGKPAAYMRAFALPGEEGTIRLGRVLTIKRGIGLGGSILRDSIAEVRRRFHPKRIYIEAQCYAAGFYEREGFQICSEEFLEDGIPHVGMVLEGKE